MDVDQLSAFLAIAQHGTVTAAAVHLHRSQSAISRRLALLEAEIGAPLFDRGPALALTDEGRAFSPRAESALAALAAAHSAARAELNPAPAAFQSRARDLYSARAWRARSAHSWRTERA